MYGIVGFIAFIFMYMFIYFDLFYIESPESVKYMLSALVQSQAAIISIVITLNFIAVQLIFSYEPQVSGVVLKKNYDMWILLFFYGISIFYGLFVLRTIPDELNGSLSQIDFLFCLGGSDPLECRVCIVYCLGIFTFAAIVPYILNTIYFLKLTTLIKVLSHNITKFKILKYIESVKKHDVDRTQPVRDDPLQPIMGIINDLIIKHNFELAETVLRAITDRTIEICDSDIEPVIISISRYFCYHLALIGIFAVRNMNGIHIAYIPQVYFENKSFFVNVE